MNVEIELMRAFLDLDDRGRLWSPNHDTSHQAKPLAQANGGLARRRKPVVAAHPRHADAHAERAEAVFSAGRTLFDEIYAPKTRKIGMSLSRR